MFREESLEHVGGWCDESSGTRAVIDQTSDAAHAIDRALRKLAQQQAGRDAEELAWLRRAQEQNIWRELGYVHALEYLEDVFAYSPHTAKERLRVARELGELPAIEQALANGELKFCIVRELTRVASAANQGAWLERARGQRLRAVEQMVGGRKKGDGPDAQPDPRRIRQRLSLDLDGESIAAWRQVRALIEGELGEKLDDRALVLELACRVLGGTGDTGAVDDDESSADGACGEEASPARDQRSVRPRYMVHVMKCPDCRRARQNGAGVSVEISADALARVECDAAIVDEENGKRAVWTIPPATKRKVMARDEWRCQVPTCRAAQFLDVHHIVHRAHGGTNDDWNLLVLCSGHHQLHHDGLLEISGRAPDQLRFARSGVELLQPARGHADVRRLPESRPASNENVKDARLALTTMGYTATEAKRAIETAIANTNSEVGLEVLVREALRHCPR